MPLMTISLLASCGGSKPSVDQFTITFNAGPEGKFFNDEQKISFKLDRGTKLLPYIKQLLPPTSEGQTFAYYEYEGGK